MSFAIRRIKKLYILKVKQFLFFVIVLLFTIFCYVDNITSLIAEDIYKPVSTSLSILQLLKKKINKK